MSFEHATGHMDGIRGVIKVFLVGDLGEALVYWRGAFGADYSTL